MDDQYVCWSFFKKGNPFTMKTDNFWIRIVFFESLLCFQLGYFHLSPSKKFSKTPKVLTKFLVKSQNFKSWNYFWWCIGPFILQPLFWKSVEKWSKISKILVMMARVRYLFFHKIIEIKIKSFECPKSIKSIKRILLGTSDSWLMIRLSHRPSNPA